MTSKQLVGNAKSRLTRASEFAITINSEVTSELLEVRLNKLEKAWVDFTGFHNECLKETDEQNIAALQALEEDFEKYEATYFATNALLTKAIRDRQSEMKQMHIFEELANQQSAFLKQLNSPSTTCSSVTLPNITVTPFSGNYKDWPSFRDTFMGSVDNKPNLTATQKFYYLKSFLRDEAADLIKHIPVSESNYVEAWDRLERRYNRVNLLVHSLIQSYMSLPTLTTPNAQILRKITDGADEVLRGLHAANKEDRDPWIIYILLNKLDEDTKREWANAVGSRDDCTIDELLSFLELRCDAYESCRSLNRSNPSRAKQSPSLRAHVAETRGTSSRCPKCKGDHILSQCAAFIGLNILLRRTFVRENSLCFNCLRLGHSANRCRSTFRCRVCKSRHHSLVHPEDSTTNSSTTPNYSLGSSSSVDPSSSHRSNSNSPQPHCSSVTPLVTNHSLSLRHQTILPTILAKVQDNKGQFVNCRVLLDTGSQSSFVTESLAQRLGLPRQHSKIPLLGLSSTVAGHTKGRISISLVSRFNSSQLSLDALILGKITSDLPSQSFDASAWNHIQGLDLADPHFNICKTIDVLLGADKVWSIVRAGQIHGPQGKPLAQNTSFGWVITGELIDGSCTALSVLHSTIDTDALLQRFWELDEVQSQASKDCDDPAEVLFRENVSRSEDGRYVVPLLFKTSDPTFGNTLSAAVSRMHAMERRFHVNLELYNQYSKFMQEYLDLGHMELIPSKDIGTVTEKLFYLPHHAVFKLDSSSTKLRVVFDGSVADSYGKSLNSQLLVGPPIQRDLIGVCLRFRQHQYVFTADIVKMFRQILIRNQETDFQRIVWRQSPQDDLKHYRLKTVTYGTASAPFLAVRVLQQLADDYKESHPNAARILLSDVYVDDIMTGTNSIDHLFELQSELINLLSIANIKLRKWSSNCWSLLAKLPPEDCEYSLFDTEHSQSTIKVLGMHWNPSSDTFSFRLTQPKPTSQVTRRILLSEIARIFDPLGFLAPSVVLFKMMFQDLWSSELALAWDDPIPSKIATRWMGYRNSLPCLQQIRIPRNAFSSSETLELHGFSDASSLAYSAVVYARSKATTGNFKVIIVAAKTKVAPLKPLSIPRLELCGALLLSRLITFIKASLNSVPIKVTAWCDSEIVLHWLSSPPRRWTTFVANRTSTILDTIPRHSWNYVASELNPADCASRGVSPTNLVNHHLWWTGPPWLSEAEEQWPNSSWCISSQVADSDPVKSETRPLPKYVLINSADTNVIQSLIDKISSWCRLVRVVALCFRFIQNCRSRSSLRISHGLRFREFHAAKVFIYKFVQGTSFSTDINDLQTKQCLSNKSKLSKYSPFLDTDGILRVGGRIRHGTVAYNIKHPILLPKDNHISFLIVKDSHERYMHTGVSETFAIVRQQFWILGSRNLIRRVIHICKPCFMQRRLTSTQLMGDLPEQRIQPSPPFSNTGCDYAGPLTIKLFRGRNPKYSKAYIALFVCMCTKAIHLEVVSDLTTDAFLAALRRFVSRRGICRNIYSDNGTNFHGARRCLNEMHQLVLSQSYNDVITSSLAKDGIAWHFIPPSAPHFGGLWEAGVKSVKLHLRRVIGSSTLTFEELTTVTSQIEAILNSRPLCCLSDSDLNPLTPSHFLIGQPLTAIPEPNHTDTPINRLSRWNHLQNMTQGFWKRWSTEYITSLQERPKWQQQIPNLKPGDIVVIKEPNLPPTKWILGKVEAVKPGSDQLVRVATVKTSTGTFVRPISKLALLPVS